MPTKQNVVVDWLTAIATSLKPSMTDKALREVVRNTARNLCPLYPPEAFTLASGAAVANGLDEFPSGLTISDRLAEWWRREGGVATTSATSLPGADDPSLEIEHRVQLQVWLDHRTAGFAHISYPTLHDRMAQALSVQRKYCPKAYAYIIRTDGEAERIAMLRGWLEDASQQRRDRTPEEIEHAEFVVREAIASMRAGPMYRKAHTLPEQYDTIDAAREGVAMMTFEAEHGRKPGEVSADTLAELRAGLRR